MAPLVRRELLLLEAAVICGGVVCALFYCAGDALKRRVPRKHLTKRGQSQQKASDVPAPRAHNAFRSLLVDPTTPRGERREGGAAPAPFVRHVVRGFERARASIPLRGTPPLAHTPRDRPAQTTTRRIPSSAARATGASRGRTAASAASWRARTRKWRTTPAPSRLAPAFSPACAAARSAH